MTASIRESFNQLMAEAAIEGWEAIESAPGWPPGRVRGTRMAELADGVRARRRAELRAAMRRRVITGLLTGLAFGLVGIAAGMANGGERWDRAKGWTSENWKPIALCAAAGIYSANARNRLMDRARSIEQYRRDVAYESERLEFEKAVDEYEIDGVNELRDDFRSAVFVNPNYHSYLYFRYKAGLKDDDQDVFRQLPDVQERYVRTFEALGASAPSLVKWHTNRRPSLRDKRRLITSAASGVCVGYAFHHFKRR